MNYGYEIIEKNAKWVRKYDSKDELQKISQLLHSISKIKTPIILDAGCGNGRFEDVLFRLYPHSYVDAVDIKKMNISYAKEHCSNEKINFIHDDIVSFLYKNNKMYDLIFFSWSLFDIIPSSNKNTRKIALDSFIELTKSHLSPNGIMLVLQPMKGGSFENLLSMFLPGSDEDYAFIHSYLLSAKFIGPGMMSTDKNNPLIIYGEFCYDNEMELYDGVSSVVALEQDNIPSLDCFLRKLNEYKSTNGIKSSDHLILSDYVNLYYYKKESST